MLTLLLILPQQVFSESLSVESIKDRYISLRPFLYVLEDPKGTLTIEQVASDTGAQIFSHLQNQRIYRYTNSVYWFRFTIEGSTIDTNLLLEEAYGLDQIELFYWENNQWIREKSGWLYPTSTRAISYPFVTFNLPIKKNMVNTFYLRIDTDSSLQVQFRLHNLKTIYSLDHNRQLLWGILYGLFLVMILYSISLGFFLKESTYFLYSFYVFFALLNHLYVNGTGGEILWFGFPYMNCITGTALTLLGCVFLLLFSQKFLSSKEFTPKLDKVISCSILIYSLLAALLFFIPLKYGFPITSLFLLLTPLLLLTVGVMTWRAGSKCARFYLLAWVVFLLGIVFRIMINFRLAPINLFTLYFYQISSALSLILIAVSFADKLNLLQKQMLLKNKEINTLNRDLEHKVEERTRELIKSYDNIQLVESQLLQTEIQAATGRLIKSVAHEMNTPLGSCITIGSLIQEKYIKNLKDEEVMAFSILMENIQKVVKLINSLKNLAPDRIKEEPDIFDINYLLREASSTLSFRSKRYKIQLEGPEPLLIKSYSSVWYQIFVNLLLNSIEHGFTNGREGIIHIEFAIKDKDIHFIYRDNGSGIYEKDVTRIFEPFYSTLKQEGHIGLGLSIVQNLIQGTLKGRIKLITDLPQGLEFQILIPNVVV